MFFFISVTNGNSKTNSSIYSYAMLCKTWGYLKYHHPVVCSGTIDWDSVLIDRIIKVNNNTSREYQTNLVITLISDLDSYDVSEEKSINHKRQNNLFEYSITPFWIREPGKYPEELVFELGKIDRSKAIEQFYVRGSEIDHPVFINERDYNFEEYKLEYGLLGLFRIWNMIEYFYPYKHLLDSDWDDILYEFIPKFLEVSSFEEYYFTVRRLASNIQDNHVGISSKVRIQNWIGPYSSKYEFAFSGNYLYVDWIDTYYPLLDSDLKIGDVILKIENIPVSNILDSMQYLVSGSNSNVLKTRISTYSMRSQDSIIEIQVRRHDSVFNKFEILSHYSNLSPTKQHYREKIIFIDSNIVYINLDEFSKNNIDSLLDVVSCFDHIIFDVRFGIDDLAENIVNKFDSVPRTFAKVIWPALNHPGKFYDSLFICGTEADSFVYGGNIYLLINGFTQSHSEFETMKLQTLNNVCTIGTNSAGADGNVSNIQLPFGLVLYFTGLGIEYPDGKVCQRYGIIPNIPVQQSVNLLQYGIDNVIQRAVYEAKK